MPRDTPLLLAPSTRLIHVGPFKTGTTALQNAFHASRHLLKPYDVHYAGRGSQPMQAALAVVGRKGRKGDRLPRPEDWESLVREVRTAGDRRVVISSEFLSSADDAVARRVVEDLASGPVHVVVTLRPIAKIAPSQWQQYIQNGVRVPYSDWLAAMFGPDRDNAITPTFWQRHDHAALIRRWSQVVGPDNLTVVVVDGADQNMLLRTFESFVGLPAGLLVPPPDSANRSLTQAEAELVRLVNVHCHESHWSDSDYAEFVRDGVARQMRTGRPVGTHDARLTMPDWALTAAARVSGQVIEAIASTGVHLVGDPAGLTLAPHGPTGGGSDRDDPDTITAVSAALAVLGAMSGSRRPRRRAKVAAAVTLLNAVSATDDDPDDGLPRVGVEQAARAVIGVLERRVAKRGLAGLPRVNATATPATLVTARRIADAMQVPEVSTADLLKAIARRGRHHARGLLRR